MDNYQKILLIMTILSIFMVSIIESAILGEDCKKPAVCTGQNVICNTKNSKCECDSGYKAHAGLCLKFATKPGDLCPLKLECSDVTNSYCMDGTCKCLYKYIEKSDQCKPGLNATCDTAKPCGTDNSECSGDNKCVCKSGYIQHLRDCVKKVSKFDETCTHNLACKDIGHSDCIGGKCECKWSYKPESNKCVNSLHSPCKEGSNDCPAKDNLECSSKRCKCKDGFFEYQGSCSPTTLKLNADCTNYRSCEKTSNLICFHGKCRCDWNYVEEGGQCLPGLRAKCSKDIKCTDKYGLRCVGEKCVCKENYDALTYKCQAKTR